MKDITHIERPNLPWRSEHATECGLDADRHPTWTREEAVAKSREVGKERFRFIVCMTCMSTAERHSTWDNDPASCLLRFCEKYQQQWGPLDADDKRRFADELRAIAMLIEAHRDEYEETVAGLATATDLTAHRRTSRRPARARFGS